MKLIYFISTLKLTSSIIHRADPITMPVLNVTLRPHMEDEEDREGDLVHADLQEALRLALDICIDIGDKGIDVLAISVEDELYDQLEASGNIRNSKRSDPFGGRLLKLSRHACELINIGCTLARVRHMLPTGYVAGPESLN